MINHIFVSFSAVEIGLGMSLAFFTIYGYITNSQYDQLSVSLIAVWVEHCIGIPEVMGSNPFQA